MNKINWKVNCFVICMAQLFSVGSFNLAIPFIPLYIRQTNMVPPEDVIFWSGVFTAASPIMLMIMSPVWGWLGDRYGRKAMLLRATVTGAVLLYFMGVVGSIYWLIFLRAMQGVFTGSIPAAQALAVTTTPEEKQGLVVGLLMASFNGGLMAGNFLGGILVMYFGAPTTFALAGGMNLLACILVLLFARENFVPPPPRPATLSLSGRIRTARAHFAESIPVLLGISLFNMIILYDGPYLSLYIDELFAAGSTAASGSGEVFAVIGSINGLASLVALLGSLAVGTVLDRRPNPWLWVGVTAAGALCAAGICLDKTVQGLAVWRSLFLFFMNGMTSLMVAILSRITPTARRGAAMGWGNTFRSVGWASTPVISAFSASYVGFVGAYWTLAAIGLCACGYVTWIIRKHSKAFDA